MPPKARRFTKKELAQVEALASVLTSDQIADYFGVGRTTFYQIMERQPAVSVRYKLGRAKAVGSVAQGLLSKARAGDTASAIFYLKTQAGWKETQVSEHTGKDGGPIKTQSVEDLTDEQLLAIASGEEK